MSAILSSGGGGREWLPGSEEWMKLESHRNLHKDLFEGVSWRLRHRGVPWFAWPMLAAAVLAISSAGAAFEQMTDVPPIILAGWRLQLTTLILLVGAAWQWHRDLDRDQRRVVLGSWKLLTASGICLALHFGFWVWSLEHTSLTHSLLFVCSVPILIACGSLLLRKPISKGEILGTLVGFAGGLLLALGPKGQQEENEVTLGGDAASLLGAVVFIGYLVAGRELRQWMPIFIYAAPVTGLAAVLLTLAGMAFEGARPFRAGVHGSFGWLVDAHYTPWIVYLSLVPGIIGHTGFNTLLRYLTPLTVSLAFQLEPLFGTLIGWFAGAVPPPGWGTWVGGIIVLVATCVVTAATAKREAKQEAKGQAVLELENVFASEQEGLLDAEADSSEAQLNRSQHNGSQHLDRHRSKDLQNSRLPHGGRSPRKSAELNRGHKEHLLHRLGSAGSHGSVEGGGRTFTEERLRNQHSSVYVIDDEEEHEDGGLYGGEHGSLLPSHSPKHPRHDV